MDYSKKRSRESRAAIERLYITMRQLIIRGNYKPSGVSGQSLTEALRSLNPEIYGSINDPEKVELDGLLYVAERLPQGIEECRFIQMVAREGFNEAGYDVIIPLKRRRNCYRIDEDRMYVEMSRGRSDIYDILTHLTFLYVEADKIRRKSMDSKGHISDNWKRLEEVVRSEETEVDEKRALVYLSNVLGRTMVEVQRAVDKFEKGGCNNLYHFVYWIGQIAIEEEKLNKKKEITFSAKLRDVIGHHVYGEQWANHIKDFLIEKDLMQRDIHIISANLHSVVNTLYGFPALRKHGFKDLQDLALHTSRSSEESVEIRNYARENGMYELADRSGTNLSIQIIDTAQLQLEGSPLEKRLPISENPPVLLVMDYAFGEQAYECMDELLKAYEKGNDRLKLNVKSISVMGKAGILDGRKGDIMLPTAHVFEGTADNYPLDNDLEVSDFDESGIKTSKGPMITVMGTSLQNRDVLRHFSTSTWNAVGLEMEGAHYQKAIQSAARIRKSVDENLKVRYAYYASDNPLVTGSTLSSGSLGTEGVRPTYWITLKILEKILA